MIRLYLSYSGAEAYHDSFFSHQTLAFTNHIIRIMRPLTETETHTLFRNYTSSSLSSLLQQPTSISYASTGPESKSKFKPTNSTTYTFRVHQSRVYHVPIHLANYATSIPRQNLLSLGTWYAYGIVRG